jgi:hypothetical protein
MPVIRICRTGYRRGLLLQLGNVLRYFFHCEEAIIHAHGTLRYDHLFTIKPFPYRTKNRED